MGSLINKSTPEILSEISRGEFETIWKVNIWSRYDDDSELQQMLQFCKYLHKIGLIGYIDELFYDTKVNTCFIRTIEFQDDANNDYELDAIYTMAILTLERFELQNRIGKRNPYLSSVIKLTL